MGSGKHISGRFPDVETCPSEKREDATILADFDGCLTRTRSPFPLYLLVALEGGSLLRAVLLLLCAPLVWLLDRVISEDAGIAILVFISCAGLKVKDVEGVARAVLPKFYADDIHPESWRVFSSCSNKCVVTATPRIMVEHFAKNHLGANTVIGTELRVTAGGRVVGLVSRPGVLVGAKKAQAVGAAFGSDKPDVGLAGSHRDSQFLQLCQEAYLVPGGKAVKAVPKDNLFKPVVFHDGRLVQRPTPWVALWTFFWIPVGFILSLIRVFLLVKVPLRYVSLTQRLVGVRLIVRGSKPQSIEEAGPGVLYVCSHRTCLDPVFISAAIGKPISAVTYSVSRLTEMVSPIPTVRLMRHRDKDAANMKRLLDKGSLVICPEGTTCREPVLLRFSALFAELTHNIVPVGILPKMTMFYGNTVRGYKALDPYFFFMNPWPQYEVIFLDALPMELTHAGGRAAVEVANHVQRMLADTMGFQCSSFTRRDKYIMLSGKDGSVPMGSGASYKQKD